MNWRRVFGVIEKYIYESRRDIFRVFDVVWWPVFQLFIWGLFSVYLQKVSPNTPNIVSILLGAVMLWSFFERASKDVTIIVVVEMWNRNLINIFATPLKISEYLMGIMVVAIAKLVVSASSCFSCDRFVCVSHRKHRVVCDPSYGGAYDIWVV